MVGGSADLLAVTWFLDQFASLPESMNGSAWPTGTPRRKPAGGAGEPHSSPIASLSFCTTFPGRPGRSRGFPIARDLALDLAAAQNGPGLCEPAGGARRGSRPGATTLSARAVRPREGGHTTCARPARSVLRDWWDPW